MRTFGSEVSLDEIRRRDSPLALSCGDTVTPTDLRDNAFFGHQTGHTVATAGVASLDELPMYPRAAVDAMALFVNDFDLFQKSHVGYFLSADDMVPEFVIATPGCVQQLAHEHDRMLMCVFADKRI